MCPGQGVRMGRDAQSRKSEPEPGAAAQGGESLCAVDGTGGRLLTHRA